MKSAESRKSIGAAMIVFSIIMFFLSLLGLIMGALKWDLSGSLWTMWMTIVLLTYSCGLVVDGKSKACGDRYSAAKNKKGVGIANLIFSLILIVLSLIGIIRCIAVPLDLFTALIKGWCSIIVFGFSIHQIVAGGHEAREAEEEEEEEEARASVTSHIVHCPNCKNTIVAYSDSPRIKCTCGKTYKNPYYDA